MAKTDEEVVTLSLQIPRSALSLQQAPPELISQENVLAVCGIPRKRYLALLRRCPVPDTRLGRLRLVDRAAFVEWIKENATPRVRSRATEAPSVFAARPTAPAPVEVLVRQLGAEVSPRLAKAAAEEVRELEHQFAKMLEENDLVVTKPQRERDPERDLRDARRAVKWAAEKIGDGEAVARFAGELGQQPCPTCEQWTDNPPCADCSSKAREAARVPCVMCGKRIDPCRDGLCRKCRKVRKLTGTSNSSQEASDGSSPKNRRRRQRD